MNGPSAVSSDERSEGIHYGYLIAALAGMAIFCGFGLGRFAYGLILPPMKAALDLSLIHISEPTRPY